MDLVIGGLTVLVEEAPMNLEPLKARWRSESGQMRSSHSGTADWARTWAVKTSLLTLAESTAILDVLKAPGTFEVSGGRLGGTPIDCIAREIREVPTQAIGMVQLQFVLEESDP